MKTHSLALTLLLALCSSALFGQKYERYKKLIDTTLVSKNLGFEKKITITVPKEWQRNDNQKFPLIVVFDRQNPRSHNYIINAIDYLTSNEQMPSAIIVGVESSDDDYKDGFTYRNFETLHKETYKNGLAKENELFVFDELIPLLETKYKASPFRIFIGHSRYGYFTTSLLTNRINELNAVISMSPFFKQKNVNYVDSLNELTTQQIHHQKFYRFSVGADFPEDFQLMDSFINTTKIENFDAKGIAFPNADHNVTPGLAIGSALYEIFNHWSEVQNKFFDNKVFDVGIIDSLEREISAFYGSDLRLGIGALNGKGWFFYGEEKYELAIKAWEVLLNQYPCFSEAHLSIIDAKKQLKQDYSKEIVAYKKSLKSSDFFSKEYKRELKQYLKELTK